MSQTASRKVYSEQLFIFLRDIEAPSRKSIFYSWACAHVLHGLQVCIIHSTIPKESKQLLAVYL